MPESDSQNKWICLREKKLLESPVMDLITRDCKYTADQREHRFYVLRSKDWCNIIPITEDGKIVMIKQYRAGIDCDTLEVPGGVADTQDGDIETTALRELEEETGYQPLPGARLIRLGQTFPNPA